MNIWYLHHYATPYEIPGLHRPFEFGEYFNKAGHKTTVFSSSYLHYSGDNLINDDQKYIVKQYGDVDAVFVKTLLARKFAVTKAEIEEEQMGLF